MTIKTKKIRTGLYEYTDKYGRVWYIEHVGPKLTGHTYNEWTVGTEDYPHADQYATKKEALTNLELAIGDEDECSCGGLVVCNMLTFRDFYCKSCGVSFERPEHAKNYKAPHNYQRGDSVMVDGNINKAGVIRKVSGQELVCDEWIVDEQAGYKFFPTGDSISLWAHEVYKASYSLGYPRQFYGDGSEALYYRLEKDTPDTTETFFEHSHIASPTPGWNKDRAVELTWREWVTRS
jgi:hypothetical protein